MPIVFLLPDAEFDNGNIASGVLTDVDEGIAAADGSLETSIANTWGGDTTNFTLNNLPGNAVSINGYIMRVRAEVGGGWVDDGISYDWRIQSESDLPVPVMVWVPEFEDGDGLVTKTSVGTGNPTVAQVNSCNIRCIQSYFQTMGPDGVFHAWDCFELEVDYSDGTTPAGIVLPGFKNTMKFKHNITR